MSKKLQKSTKCQDISASLMSISGKKASVLTLSNEFDVESTPKNSLIHLTSFYFEWSDEVRAKREPSSRNEYIKWPSGVFPLIDTCTFLGQFCGRYVRTPAWIMGLLIKFFLPKHLHILRQFCGRYYYTISLLLPFLYGKPCTWL